MSNIRVEDVILQTIATLVNLAGRRLGLADEPGQDGDVDVQQAQLAIDGAQGAGCRCAPRSRSSRSSRPSPSSRWPSRGRPRRPAGARGEPGRRRPPDPEAREGREDEERAKARSKIWTPGSGDRDRRDLRRVGLLLAPRRRRGGRDRHSLRAAVGAHPDGGDRGHAGGVHAPPRRRAHAAAAPHQLPRQRLGDEAGGRRSGSSARRACGALKAELAPGTFVVCDQFVDRTRGREDTFYDGPQTTHVSAADPYCPDLRAMLVGSARELEIPVVDGGHGGGHRRARASRPGPSRAGSPRPAGTW